MNSSAFIPRAYPSPSREAGLKIRPVACSDPAKPTQPSGPGSGSLGEFIEKIDSERSDKLVGQLSQEKMGLARFFFVVFSNTANSVGRLHPVVITNRAKRSKPACRRQGISLLASALLPFPT